MWITVEADDPRPIYEQVADGVRALIARGALAEGDPLPPVRQVASDLGVNLNTIATAYRALQDEGLIAIRHGSGAVVASRRSKGPSGQWRRTLGAVVTQMVLAGMRRADILEAVSAELRALDRRSR